MTRRVLLVDDDPALRAILSRWLTRRGYETNGVGTGSAATAQVRLCPPDLLVVDGFLGN